MNNLDIVKKINEFLHTATGMLCKWLKTILPLITENWWEECVWEKLSFGQKSIAEEKNISSLEALDLAALLRIADKNWYAMREFSYLPNKQRDCIHEMQSVRNNWAHCSGILPGKDTILANLHTIADFFEQLNGDNRLSIEIEQFISAVEKSDLSVTVNQPLIFSAPVSAINNEIKERDIVYLVSDPNTTGMVFSVKEIGDTIRYEIFVNGTLNTYYSGQIVLQNSPQQEHWIDDATFQSYLSAYQLNNPSSSKLYSLNTARIDFVSYQFRPALKLIKADKPRILIADSVGVGKTIEAGLIIKELEARNELERILIICPKPLVTERKWELEMKRFDEDFIPLQGAEFRQILSDTERDKEWPARYGKVIIPYSILDSVAFNGVDEKNRKQIGLKNLDPAPHFDLVIIDEAHHIRNGSTEKEKAFAYKCVKYFCDNADAVVMLTATPLQNSDDDLYTLLNVLRPDIIIDKNTFRVMAKPNAYISRCVQHLRSAHQNWQTDALQELINLHTTQWGENIVTKNPIYLQSIDRLSQPSLTREDRVQLIGDVESLHSFNNMLNRTRRKDIQDFCIRRSHTLETEFTVPQKELHDELLKFERAALATMHDIRTVPFMMSTIRRQAASCIFGLAPFVRDLIDRRFEQLIEDPEIDVEGFLNNSAIFADLQSMADNILTLADNLPAEDPKFDSVLKVIKQKQENENNKIILFSTFRHTLAYVKKKLRTAGFRVEQIDGSVKDETRCLMRERFKKQKSDSDAIDILLFTEVGSEGLDYQFCDMMINYDLPWNPMRIEQRIGRIDRRGQMSEVVNIYNVITSGTVDADIYNRCLMRIGVFERSIGECEEILGEIGSKIEKIVVDSNLTEEERRYKLEQMADNEVRKAQDLSRLEDEEKGLFGFDLSSYLMAKEIQEAENPWITPKNLQRLVQRYLNARIGEGNYITGNNEIKNLKISYASRCVLKDDFNALSGGQSALKRKWEHYLKGANPNLSITFEQETANQNRDIQFITAVHPLIRQAAKYFKQVKPVYIKLKYISDDIPRGVYPFSVYLWNYIGINAKSKVQVICPMKQIIADWNNIAMNAVSVNNPNEIINKRAWDDLEERHIALWKQEKAKHCEDVKATIDFRINSLKNSFDYKLRVLEQKIGDSFDPSIRRMYQSSFETEQEKNQLQLNELQQRAQKADIEFTLIANGFVVVE